MFIVVTFVLSTECKENCNDGGKTNGYIYICNEDSGTVKPVAMHCLCCWYRAGFWSLKIMQCNHNSSLYFVHMFIYIHFSLLRLTFAIAFLARRLFSHLNLYRLCCRFLLHVFFLSSPVSVVLKFFFSRLVNMRYIKCAVVKYSLFAIGLLVRAYFFFFSLPRCCPGTSPEQNSRPIIYFIQFFSTVCRRYQVWGIKTCMKYQDCLELMSGNCTCIYNI